MRPLVTNLSASSRTWKSTRPHTLWEPLGVQWWKRRNNDNKSGGLDKVARLRVGRWGDKGARGKEWHAKKPSETDLAHGGIEGFRDHTYFKQEKRGKKWRNKGGLSIKEDSKSSSSFLFSAPLVLISAHSARASGGDIITESQAWIWPLMSPIKALEFVRVSFVQKHIDKASKDILHAHHTYLVLTDFLHKRQTVYPV